MGGCLGFLGQKVVLLLLGHYVTIFVGYFCAFLQGLGFHW